MKNTKTITKLLIASVIFFTVINTASAGDDDKVKAMVGDLPSEMTAGSSVQFSVTLTNTGNNTWSSDKLSAKETGPFDITKSSVNVFNLEPGQSQTLNYTITAPSKTGKQKCKVYFYTTGRKIGSKTKTINVK